MSEQRPLKRRALENHRTDFEFLHQQQQVESLQAELDHERAARQLDIKKFNQKVRRLEQQVSFAVQEAAEAKELLEQTVAQTDRRVEQLTSERDRALQHNRQLQLQIADNDDASHASTEIEQYRAKCEHLEQQVTAQAENEASYRREIDKLKEEIQSKLQNVSTLPAETRQHPLLEEAPAAVLSELNKTRIKLAETERKCRQLDAKYKDVEKHNRELISKCERHQGNTKRLAAVTSELQTLNRKYEEVNAESAAWKEFGSSLSTILHTQTTGHPPERSAVLRFLKDAQHDCQAAQQTAIKYKQECEHLRTELAAAQTQSSISLDMKRQQREWVTKLKVYEQKLTVSQQQAALYQRESESLRALIATFEQQMESKQESSSIDPAMKVLQVRFDTVKEQLKDLQAEHEKCLADSETTKNEKLLLATELDQVREKYAKLRDALQESKQKLAAAEERAVAAEQLSGKGSFDPSRTRVLHFTETPLVQALKEEVQVLKRQLQTLKTSSSSSPSMTADPEKLNQRLKETFRGQIATFREGVYLATGYKIDMLTADSTQRPTFRIRSVFAEHEEDHLLLRWPKDESQSMDILHTDFAKELSTQPCYDYMTKFHSLPAFLASVTLSLFEKQTVMM